MAEQAIQDTGRNVQEMQTRLGPLTQIDYAALNYFLQGRTLKSINEELGVGSQRLHSLLNRPSIKEIFASVKETQKFALASQAELVIQTHRELLTNADPNVRDRAVDKWYKTMGWYDNKLKLQIEAGAEDVAAALLAGGARPPDEEAKTESELAHELEDD